MTESRKESSSLLNSLQSELELYPDLGLSRKTMIVLTHIIDSLDELSNDPFEEALIHSLSIAGNLAELRVRQQFIVAAVIFILEDLGHFPPTLFDALGTDIRDVVTNLIEMGKFRRNWSIDSISQIQKKHNPNWWQRQTDENTIRAFLSIARYTENIVIIVSDRLFRLQHFDNYFPINEELKRLIANETLSVYSALAEMLGIWPLKWQLDDTAFKFLDPRMYYRIHEDLNEGRTTREELVQEAIAFIEEILLEEGVSADVTGRAKHIFGIFQKMELNNLTTAEVNDSLAIRIIVKTEEECYLALSILHDLFQLPPNIYGNMPYRDWIERPKPNGYRSIHTTIIFPSSLGDRLLEVQIRTHEMHEEAEYGVAAHWIYRRAGNAEPGQKRHYRNVDDIAQLRKSFERQLKLISSTSVV